MNMFINALEEAFDTYFTEKHPGKDLNAPNVHMEYRRELEAFAKFLIEEYVRNIEDMDYWERRISQE